MDLKSFHQNFYQTLLSDSHARRIMIHQSFRERVCHDLIEIGDLTDDFSIGDYKNEEIGIEVCGYDYDEERSILTLVVHELFQKDTIEKLTQKGVNIKFSYLNKFLEESISGLYKDMEQTSESYSIAYDVYYKNQKEKIKEVHLLLLTNGQKGEDIELKGRKISGLATTLSIVDIKYLHNIYSVSRHSMVFEVDTDLPYLLATGDNNKKYQSYLTCISGDEIYRIYSKFGQKLLDQNVRTFLQFKGQVNKGLKNTIVDYPEMFFAYNNGLTATASKVETKDGRIVKVHDLQIVNGGQTTSGIYAAKEKYECDLSKISVPMKLSVITSKDDYEEYVPKISECANTQNKMNKSDFFSNSIFHREFKNIADRVFAPNKDRGGIKTRWYYERVRGEYLNDKAYLSPTKQKQFEQTSPKNQLIDKTALSKSENSWEQKPHIVSKGAQTSFVEFADVITQNNRKDNLHVTEQYFKDAISRFILFQKTEKIINNASWYDGGFRAQTVTYSIAYLSRHIKLKNQYMNFNLIWKIQTLPEEINVAITTITKEVYDSITSPPEGQANIAQWCKREACWEKVKELSIKVDVDSLLIDKGSVSFTKKVSKEAKKLDAGIEKLIVVYKLSEDQKTKLLKYYSDEEDATHKEFEILKSFCNGKQNLPSEREADVIHRLYDKAKEEGAKI